MISASPLVLRGALAIRVYQRPSAAIKPDLASNIASFIWMALIPW
jgi:hypothetical protein